MQECAGQGSGSGTRERVRYCSFLRWRGPLLQQCRRSHLAQLCASTCVQTCDHAMCVMCVSIQPQAGWTHLLML